MGGLRNGRRALLPLILCALLSAVLVAGCTGGSAPAPAHTSAAATPAARLPGRRRGPNRAGELFPAATARTLQGLLIGTGPVGIVLAHESGADLCQWKPYAYALSRQGYRVLAFNFIIHLPEDVTGAVAALRARGQPARHSDRRLDGSETRFVVAAATTKPPVAAGSASPPRRSSWVWTRPRPRAG